MDALGSTAYHDVAGRESIPGCHRSKAAEIHIGGIESANLACSGARTYTQPYSSGSDFKPGLDFYDDGAGHIGQAKALQQYASTPPRAADHGPDQREQLRLRRRRPDLRDRLADLAVVVEELLQRRLEHPQPVHRQLHRPAARRHGRRLREHPPGDDQRGLRRVRLPARRADLLVPDPARQRLPLQGDRLHAPDDRRLRRLEPRRRLGQRHDGPDARRARDQAGRGHRRRAR